MDPKTVKKAATGLTKKVSYTEITYEKYLPKAQQLLADGLQALTGCIAMRNLTDPQLRDLFDYAKSVEDAITEAAKLARARVLDVVLNKGAQSSDAGSKRMEFSDGRYLLAKCTRSGVDPKQLEAHLRSKGKDPNKYMTPTVTFKVDQDGLLRAVADGVLSQAEIDALRYTPSYSLERSKENK